MGWGGEGDWRSVERGVGRLFGGLIMKMMNTISVKY